MSQEQLQQPVDENGGSVPLQVAPPLTAHRALVVACSLSAAVPSRQAHVDCVAPTAVDRDECANRWAVLALSGTAAFMTTLDSSIVNIALPSIAHAFGVALTGAVEWILIGYLVVIAATLLTFGRVADSLGRKPLFLGGLFVFTLGSALCGAAPSLGTLIAARCFQGLGAAAIFSVNIAMITRAFPASERGRALGINAILVALGVSVGPTIGGLLTQLLTWRWIFYVNLPVGGAALAFIAIGLRPKALAAKPNLDLLGAILLTVGACSLLLGLSWGGSAYPWLSAPVLALALTAIGSFALLAVVERRAAQPILPPELFGNSVFVVASHELVLSS